MITLVIMEFDQFSRNISLVKYLKWMHICYISVVIKPARNRVIQNSRSIEIILEVVYCLQIVCEVHSVLQAAITVHLTPDIRCKLRTLNE